MNTSSLLLISLLANPLLLAEKSASDFLRFKNDDTLHGSFLGIDEGPLLQWKSHEAEETISFSTKNLRKLSLNHGQAKKTITDAGLITLNNGDRILGKLTGMDSEALTIETEFAGTLTIPRNTVSTILPNRHGSDVLYAGPFNELGWEVPGNRSTEEQEDDVSPPEHPPWQYGGAAWQSNSTQVIRLNTELPDLVSIRFNLAWRAPLNVSMAVFADFQRPALDLPARVRRVPLDVEVEEDLDEPEAPEDEELEEAVFEDIMVVGPGGNHEAENFGSGYLVSVLSNYSKLQRLGFREDNRGKKSSFPNSGGRLNLADLNFADFEIRANRKEGIVSLFIDGDFYSEWHDLHEPFDDAKRYFALATGSKSSIRISDVVISEWNGMPDSARSMQTQERDVLLLANGTDRISGTITSLENDIFQIDTVYGKFQIPTTEVTNIQLALGSVVEPPESTGDEIIVSFQPNGLITLQPHDSSSQQLNGKHPILGDLTLDLGYAYLLEFDPIGSIFDNWDNAF